MTDQELIELVQSTTRDDLSPEQIEALRQAMSRSAALREALADRLQMEQYLGHVLGHVEVSVDRIFERAKLEPTNTSAARLLFGGVAILVLLGIGIGLWQLNKEREPIARVNPPPAASPATGEEPEAPESADAKLTDTAAKPATAEDTTPPVEGGPMPSTGPEPWKLVIEAEDFARGDVATDDRVWGRHIGIVKQKGAGAAFVEYDVQVPQAGRYRLDLRYAADESIPLKLSINGELVKASAAGEDTGDWLPDAQRWFNEGLFTLRAGKNTIRLESDVSRRRRDTFPALDQLALTVVPRPPEGMVPVTDPWHDVVAATEPPPAFKEVCFVDFSSERALRATELTQWLEQVPGHAIKTREQSPACIFDGLARLRSPWREDLALRLSLWDHHGFRLHFWSGQQGLTLWYYQYPPTWVAYQTTRDSDKPQPKTYAWAAVDEHRYGRTSHGAFELRYVDGRLYMTRGDMLLLSAALPQPPSEVYFEGHAGIRGITLARSAGLPTPPKQRPAVLASDEPARLPWRTDLPEGATLNKRGDGSIELTTENLKSWAQIGLPYPATGLYEVIFQIDDPQPGTGVFLGDEQCQPQHKVAFLKDTRSGQTSLAFMAPADKRVESSEDISQKPASYALKRHWIKLILGCGTIKNYVSDDGLHFSRGDSPLQTNAALKGCTTLGIYCVPGDVPRRIRLRNVEVRALSSLNALLPPQLERDALALTGDSNWTLGDWLAQVIDNQPAGVDATAWRRACAIKTLRAGPTASLGTSILLGLLDEMLAEPVPLADRLALLEEIALLAPTWNYDSRQLGVDVATRYDTLGQRMASEGESKPYSAIGPALLTSPIVTSSSIPAFPEMLVRHELLSLIEQEQWDEALRLCDRVEYWNRPSEPGRRVFARESFGGLVEWSRAIASRYASDRQSRPSTPLRGEWRHPLVEVLSKEGYNILAEFNAALDGEAYADACQIVSSADPQGALGLLPDAKDSRLLVSLPAAVALAMREQPKLRQTMREQFGPRGRLRVRQAITDGDLVALEAATMQFCGTEAAAEAHLWLGDRALAAGDFLHAIGEYRLSLQGGLPAGTVEPRLRLAAAMLGREEGQPLRQSVSIGGLQWKPEEFEDLVAEMLARNEEMGAMMPSNGDRSAAEIETPLPGRYEPQKWADFNGDLGRDPQQTRYPAVDAAGRQLAVVIEEELMLVSNRFQVAAYELKTGSQRWVARLDKQQGSTHEWPLTPMKPVVAGERVFVRRLTNRGPDLACLNLTDGKLLWTAKPGDHVASDPLVAQDQLLAITTTGTQDNYLQINLAAFDPRTGEVLFQRPLVQLRDVWSRKVPCQAITLDDRVIATCGGSVICCDLLGQVHWLRRQAWLPQALDDNWEQQYVQTPLVSDNLLYLIQPGVRVMECLEAATGRLRWQHVLTDVCRLCGLVGDNLIVETARGVQAYEAASGVLTWRRECQLLSAQACGTPGGLLVVENDRMDNEQYRPSLLWLDATTGRQAGRSPLDKLADKQPMVGPLVVHQDRLWTFFGRGSREAAREIHELKRTADASPVVLTDQPLRTWRGALDNQLQQAAAAVAPGWTLLSGVTDGKTRWQAELRGQPGVLVTSAADKRPARFDRLLDLPRGARARLILKVGHEPEGKWGLDVRVGSDSLLSQTIDSSVTRDGWAEFNLDLTPYAGRREWVTVMQRHLAPKPAYAAWQRLDIVLEQRLPTDPPHGE